MYMNLYQELRDCTAYQFLADRVCADEQSMSFLNDRFSDIHIWRDMGKKRVKELLYYQPAPVPFNEAVIEEQD